jgi:hypothetical protein
MPGFSSNRDILFAGERAPDARDDARLPTRSEIRAHLYATDEHDSLEALAAFAAGLRAQDRAEFLSMYYEERAAMVDAQHRVARTGRLSAVGVAIVVVVIALWVLLA